MQNLLDIQTWMQQCLRQPSSADNAKVHNYLMPCGSLSIQESLGIYQRSYDARLLTCLQQQFPALYYCLGEDTFHAFARDYLHIYPSQSYTLHDLGKNFVTYLQDTRPDKQSPPDEREIWIDFMVELASFERLAFIMFDAEGDEGRLAAPNTMQQDNKLQLQRCLYLYSAQFPVADYYCQVRDDKNPTLPSRYPNYLVLVRVAYRTRIISVNSLEFRVLQNLQKTRDIQNALFLTAEQSELASSLEILTGYWSNPGGWRDTWLQNGYFRALT